MFYAYILESVGVPGRRYVGSTADLRQRVARHNAGRCPATARFRPWKVAAYFAFERMEVAEAFERYLKSGSGHAFARRHFW